MFILLDSITKKTSMTTTNFYCQKANKNTSNKKWKTNYSYIPRTMRTCITFHFYLEYHRKILVATYNLRIFFYHINTVLMVGIFQFRYPIFFPTHFCLNKNCLEKAYTSWKLVDGSTIFCILNMFLWR